MGSQKQGRRSAIFAEQTGATSSASSSTSNARASRAGGEDVKKPLLFFATPFIHDFCTPLEVESDMTWTTCKMTGCTQTLEMSDTLSRGQEY